jgi:hypothetical protein
MLRVGSKRHRGSRGRICGDGHERPVSPAGAPRLGRAHHEPGPRPSPKRPGEVSSCDTKAGPCCQRARPRRPRGSPRSSPHGLGWGRQRTRLALRAPVAQWIERCPPEAEVAGSNPAGRAPRKPRSDAPSRCWAARRSEAGASSGGATGAHWCPLSQRDRADISDGGCVKRDRRV